MNVHALVKQHAGGQSIVVADGKSIDLIAPRRAVAIVGFERALCIIDDNISLYYNRQIVNHIVSVQIQRLLAHI